MATKWSDLSVEGQHLRYIHNRIMRRFKKHEKAGDDDLMIKAATSICTVANTQRRIVEGASYEQRLGDIEQILYHIPKEVIMEAKRQAGV